MMRFLQRRRNAIGEVYREYPAQFWVLVLGTFIDRLGGALLFPFFTLYLTQKFSIGMTEVGGIFALFSISSVVGSFFGGALSDRFGRKGMLLFGLVASGLSSLLMGVIDELQIFLFVTILVGVLANSAGPAQQAMVADLLPEEKRAGGFGILRVVVNLAVTIGPLLGGLLAAQSFLLLFVSDAVTSMITAVFIYFALKETKRALSAGETEESVTSTFRGYGVALRDTAFLWYLGASVLAVIVYIQMNTTLAVYLRDVHGVSVQRFGYILSLNAAMVVMFQFSITRRIEKFRPLAVMTVGTLFYAVGFAMYGFVSAFWLFLVAMAVITIGEMLVSPVGQAIVARFAPEDMRGRYMAVYGFSWVLPAAVGPMFAGIVMDNYNPDWVWYLAGILALLAAGAYYGLQERVGRARWEAVERRVRVFEQLELGKLSAEEAGKILEGIGDGVWSRLRHEDDESLTRHVRIRIRNLGSGGMKNDLRIPLGLVTAALNSGGRISEDIDGYDVKGLSEMIDRSRVHGPQIVDSGDDQWEIEVE